jgi:hypothetical protein
VPLDANGLTRLGPPTPTPGMPLWSLELNISRSHHEPTPQLVMRGLMAYMLEVIVPNLIHAESISQLDDSVNLRLHLCN